MEGMMVRRPAVLGGHRPIVTRGAMPALAAAAFLMIASGCTPGAYMGSAGGSGARANEGAQSEADALRRMEDRQPGRGAVAAGAQLRTDRMLVRTASLTIDSYDPAPLAPRIMAFVERVGGQVDNLTTQDRGAFRATLRVPAASLDQMLDSLAAFGRVRTRSVSARDVTEQAVDMDARLASMRLVRDRLRALLERAATVADAVAVERELGRVQQELDSLEARLAVLRTRVAMAEIHLEVDKRVRLGPLGLLLAGVGYLLGRLFFVP